ncbi:F-box domain [Arabidopsis suecica]|uniref:F-box domain n=1 Tax=Arabidopsis suecica TaxID=45249 RepID=A0A8T2B5X9_ARASU|nr:F-box domain [Arabidopsis suecica]
MKKSKITVKRVWKKETIAKNDEENTVSIPLDLIREILTRLPPKPLVKLISISKLWYSTIRKKDFTDLFLARSLIRPCFLFTFSYAAANRFFFNSFFYKSPSSLHRNTTSYTTLDQDYTISSPVRGLMSCHNGSKVVIFNPSTGQVLALPKVKTRRKSVLSFLGYDPVEDVYKVLCMTMIQVLYQHRPFVWGEHQVFTLGAETKEWRRVDCHIPHFPATLGLCKDGVVYYGAWSDSDRNESLVVCFDVGSEQFRCLKLPNDVEIQTNHRSEVVNYHKKIALVEQTYGGVVDLWVLDDVEKKEWSKKYLVVPSWNDLVGQNYYFRCRGTIWTGEFVFTPHSQPNPSFIVYYDLKKDSATRVEIEDGFPIKNVFLDHVENPMFL